MRKPAVLIGLALGAGVAICAPDIRAYRRLAGITRTLRQDAAEPAGQLHAHPYRESR